MTIVFSHDFLPPEDSHTMFGFIQYCYTPEKFIEHPKEMAKCQKCECYLFPIKDGSLACPICHPESDFIDESIRIDSGFEDSINKAKEELETLISKKSNYFIFEAVTKLQNYIEIKLIGKNLTHYKQSNYYKGDLESIKMISKAILSYQNGNNLKDSSSEEVEQICEKNKTSP